MTDSALGSARLTILSGEMSGRELVLDEVVDNILIGADPSCRFHLPVPGISPIHARIWMDAAGVTVYDTHSPRGLYVNDDRVNGQAPLRNGDILWLGTPGDDEAVMIQVRLPPRGAPAEPPPAEALAPTVEPEVVAPEEEGAGETVMLSAKAIAPPEPDESLEVVEEEPESAEPAADATMVMGPDEGVLVEEEAPADATIVMGPADEEPALAEVPAEEEPPLVEEPAADATILEMPAPQAQAPPADAFFVEAPPLVETQAVAFEETHALPALDDAPVKFAVELPPLPVAPAPEPSAFEDETLESPAETTMLMDVPQQPLETTPPAAVAPPAPPPAPAPPPVSVAAQPPAPARPAVAVEPPRPARPAPRPPAPVERVALPSSSGRYAALGAVGLLVLGGGAFVAWKFLQQPAPAQDLSTPAPTTMASTEATPETLAPVPATPAPVAIEPPVEEAVTIVRSPPPSPPPGASPSPAARPTPTAAPKATAATPPPVAPEVARAQQVAAQVSSLLGQADAAASARNFDSAGSLYDDVLKLDPQNAKAAEGKSSAHAALASLKKTFVAGKTTVQSGKAAKGGGMAGFDSEDVSLAKAPDYSGRIEFEANPRNVKPGDSYTVLIYLTNDGKKSFKLNSVAATTSLNGAKSGGPVQPKAKSADPQQRVLLAEAPGVWQAGTNNWSLEIVVTSDHNDTFKNTLSWR
jgi:hypothetical protein